MSVLRAPWIDLEPGVLVPRWRVVFNRDERRARAAGRPPVLAEYDGVPATFPVDPMGGGTWLAATGAGLVFAVLNEPDTRARADGDQPLSRGRVIPALLPATSCGEVESRLRRYDVGRHRPFRLLVASDDEVLEAASTPHGLHVSRRRASPRLIRTSSSVAPEDTARRRMTLFDRLVPEASMAAQDRFHAHQWRRAPGASVLMARPDARTVSISVVDVFAHGVRLTYRPLPAGQAGVTEMARAA